MARSDVGDDQLSDDKPRYALVAVMGKDEASATGEPAIEIFFELTPEVYERALRACVTIRAFRAGDLFPYLRHNYDQYYAVRAAFMNIVVNQGPLSVGGEGFFRLTAEFLNWLSSMRLFVDQTENKLSAKYGKESAELKRFRVKCSEEFDTVFAYRFMWKLRNYSQHRAIPLSGGSVSSRLVGKDQREHEIEVVFTRDNLLNERDVWGAKVRGELAAMSEKFPLEPLLDQAMECLNRLADVAMSLIFRDIASDLDTVAHLEEKFTSIPGEPYIAQVRVSPTEDGTLELTPLPFHELGHIRAVIARWSEERA